jgi:tetrahydromethanopterin S-methyltransferase subunit G
MTDEELKALFQANADAMHQRFEQIDSRFEQIDSRLGRMDARFEQIDARLDETNRRIETTSAELRHQFEIAAEHTDSKFERLVEVIALLDEKIDRRTNGIEEEMRRGFADTHALIESSYADLDRRVRVLEDSKSTH